MPPFRLSLRANPASPRAAALPPDPSRSRSRTSLAHPVGATSRASSVGYQRGMPTRIRDSPRTWLPYAMPAPSGSWERAAVNQAPWKEKSARLLMPSPISTMTSGTPSGRASLPKATCPSLRHRYWAFPTPSVSTPWSVISLKIPGRLAAWRTRWVNPPSK